MDDLVQLQASFFFPFEKKAKKKEPVWQWREKIPALFMSVMIGDWVRNITYLTGDGMENLLNEDILNVRELSNTSQMKVCY